MPIHKPPTYSHRLRSSKAPNGSDGKPLKCRVLKDNGRICQIEFENGDTAIVERYLVRRAKDAIN